MCARDGICEVRKPLWFRLSTIFKPQYTDLAFLKNNLRMNIKTDTKFPRGSEWRKWDMHVHSPASANFKGDYPGFIIQIGSSDCAVVGINDYFSVAGYKEVQRRLNEPSKANGNKAYRDALERLRSKTLLPVIECRMTNIVMSKKAASGTRFNFHIVFNNELDVADVERFLMGLRVSGESVGAKRYNDSDFLLNHAAVDFAEVMQALADDAAYKNQFLIWMPYDEYGGIDTIDPRADKLFKDGLIRQAHILGSGNKKQSDFFLWNDPKFTQAEYVKWFGRRKPCIKGSDSHSANDEVGRLKDKESKPIDRYCWIKADPTFDGLRQITNEPEDRVFIGAEPPKLTLVNSNKTRFLTRIQIQKTPDAKTQENWFAADLSFNHDMVAIIGNKGSGKSALADIIALGGDSAQARHFSFLSKNKFREKKLASNFEVTTTWADGKKVTRNLQSDPDPSKPEAVKYISQSYLEYVCTETSGDEASAFQRELRGVIFSHISDSDRLGRQTLDELIDYKSEEINAQINLLRQQISQVNSAIAALETKASPTFRKQLVEALAKKKQELDSHDQSRPVEVKKPEAIGEDEKKAHDALQAELSKHRNSLATFETQIATAKTSQKNLTEKLSLVAKLETRLTNIEAEYNVHQKQSAEGLATLGLHFDKLVQLTINKKPLLDARSDLQKAKESVDNQLNDSRTDSLPAQHKSLMEKVEKLQGQLDEPNKRYQKFLEQLKSWQSVRLSIEGTSDKPETLRHYEAQLSYVDTQLQRDIEAQRAARSGISRNIYARISDLRNVYGELFAPVQNLIETSVIIKEGFKLTFASTIVRKGFRRRFFEHHINQSVNGSFCGREAGEQRLDSLLEDIDLTKADDAILFAEQIEDHLRYDHRQTKKQPMELASQLRKHATARGLYDFLWSFEYLIPEYSLKLDGKGLTQLSPGERGALLLVFYLLVDKSELPIIVDQPEENLDNQTVFRLLIPVIKDAKRRRQIIMVTHNPNIAVVCDAEQIVHASFDRAQGNRVTYTSGPIEDRIMNKHIVDVLEGTRPAFDNRDDKYY
jgi:ABC-type lipoprotein export system ATPase subunit